MALVAVALVLVPGGARAHSYTLGTLAIGHVWAPPAEAGGGAPVYGPLLNRANEAARLVGASTPIADRVRFRILDKDGTAHWPDAVELPAGKPVALAAWRVHLWLVGLHRPLHEGDSFELTLDFGQAGKLLVKVIVERSPSD
jgi:hypothetical protein